MARRKQRDQAFGQLVKSYFLESAEARNPRERAWDKAYKRADPSYVDKGKIKGPFKLKVPYVYRTLEVQTAQLIQASEANGRWVIARSTTAEHGPIGDAVSQALENQFVQKSADVRRNNDAQLEAGARMGLNYGNCDFKIDWAEEGEWWGCTVLPIDPYDNFRDWKYGRWYIFRRAITLRDIETIAKTLSAPVYETQADPETGAEVQVEVGKLDGGQAERAFKKLYGAVKSGKYTGYLWEENIADHGRQRQADYNRVEGDDAGLEDAYVRAKEDPYNARVTLLEYHETKNDGIVAQIVPDFKGHGDDLVFRKERTPYGVCQIVPFVPRPVDNEQYGLGLGEVVGHTSEAMDIFYRAQLRQFVRIADPAVLYRKGLRLRQEYLRSQSGVSIPVSDTVNDIRYMDPPSNPGLHQAGFAFAKSMADLGTGESDSRRGNVGGADSATEAAIAEQAANITDRAIFRRWKRTIEQIAHVMLALMKVHVTREKLIPILGRKTEMFYRLKPEHLTGQFEVQFGGNVTGSNPVQRQQGYRMIAQTYGAAGVVDLNELARSDVEELGVADPDKYLTAKSEPPSVPPREEHTQLFDFGEFLEVSPADNDLAHYNAHNAEYARRVRENHPRAGELAVHIQQHIQSYMLKQQAQQMQQMGAQQAGPQPFQPHQAGQPGQPGAFNQRTADVNQQRQMSNQAAPGQSPGPTAPNRPVGGLARGPA